MIAQCSAAVDVTEIQIDRFVPPKSAGEQDSQECAITFARPTPIFLTPLTRLMPAARSGLNSPQSDAS
jgi:hypothetical protein